MAKDISIVFKAVDNLTNSVQTMRTSTRNLTKDIGDFKKIKDEAFNTKSELKLETSKAKQELKELEKAMKEGKEGAEQAFTAQQKKVLQLEDAYKSLGKTISEASTMERKLSEDMLRRENSKRVNGKGSMMDTLRGGLGALAGNELAKMVGGELVNFGSFQIGRTFGADTGQTVSNIGGGAMQGATAGAMLGTALGGPVGTAIGAAGGAIVGAATGALKDHREKQEKIDDAFRSDVRELYTMTKEQSKGQLEHGIGLAGKGEKDIISFSTLFGGDKIANEFMKNAQNFAAVTPFETEDIVEVAKKLSAYGYKANEIVDAKGNGLMKSVGNAGSALGMSREDMQWIATSIGRMKASDKASLEYLNPLVERGIPAIEWLAKDSGRSQKEIYEAISKGSLSGKEVAEVIAGYMDKTYNGNMEKQSHTYEGMKSNLEDQQAFYDKAQGQGYIEERKRGMEGQIAFHEKNGESIQKANKYLGEFQARLENIKDEKMNLELEKVMSSPEFDKADESQKALMVQKARVDAVIAYRKTDEFALQQQTDLELIQGIQSSDTLNAEYFKAGQQFGNQLSKGLNDEVSKGIQNALSQINGLGAGGVPQSDGVLVNKDEHGNSKADAWFKNKMDWVGGLFKPKAVGSDRIPYDGYPTLLHEGERVLTKAQVNTEPTGSGIVINMNNTVREEADIYKIAQALSAELSKYQASYGGE